MNEILNHLEYFEQYPGVDYTDTDLSSCFPKEWMQIFYIARCLFSSNSNFPIKGYLASLLNRKEIFPKKEEYNQQASNNESTMILNMGETLDIGRIRSVNQLSQVLPREFIINLEDIFYKKLLNRELCKKEFNCPESLSVSELVYGKEKDLNRKQKIYILFDNSSSMNGERFNKLYAVKAICIEYLKKVEKEGPQIYFRYFNQDMGPLLKVSKPSQIKNLIRYINNLNTAECYETRIGDAILKAASDIRSDPSFRQAEILMITDGLGEVPQDIKTHLGKIKFHIVLISGLDIDCFLKSYPTRDAWEKANIKVGAPNMPPDWETCLKIKQVYQLEEISNIFVRIPSLIGERFNFGNAFELDMVKELREKLSEKLKNRLTNKEKYKILKQIRFMTKYLQTMLSKKPPNSLKKNIKQEIKNFQILTKRVMEDSWFAANLDNIIESNKRRKNKELIHVLGKSDRSWMIVLLLAFLKFISGIPKRVISGFESLINHTRIWLIRIHRRQKIRKRFNHINSKFMQILYK